ncbi:MAG: hypothetical protein H6Q14_292 [Bacteroidetes bacterium]|nr:hypothetical protein [Bacteroidota bacterium]
MQFAVLYNLITLIDQKMKKIFICILLLVLFCFPTLVNAQLIQNRDRLGDMERMLEMQRQLTSKGKTNIWTYLQKNMPSDEKQALRFLYAYMPLSDMADYTPSFMQMNVKYALRARSELPWGKNIPEDVFLHFVLPLRINNENLDSFREVMYQELKERVKGLSMKDAALEVNHWCHQKVTYRGTDARTSAPLSAVKKSFGRCGEESTFAVTALRTVGIPARQVYTPRWAHSDDNHAWVEVWIDGKWYFMGACEPDPELNMGWFAEPATRAMLVHTRAYGRYFGSENVVTVADRFSELNLTANYAPVKKVNVWVKDEKGLLVDSAKVEFGLYNYAEYYPIATRYTVNGKTDLTVGLGELLLWASYKGKFGYAKLSVPATDSLVLTLKNTFLNNLTENYFMVPPKVGKVTVSATADEIKHNSQRLLQEDSIRHAYMSTFKDSVWAASLATRLGLDHAVVKEAIAKSYGNWSDISEYLEKGTAISRKYVLAFLKQLSDKDFSDASASVLLSQLASAVEEKKKTAPIDEDLFVKYVLAPRLANENLSPWRKFLLEAFSPVFLKQTRNDILVLKNWITQNVLVDNVANMHSRTPLSPEGVFRLKVADKQSRDLFFVAACRSFGIPARINQATLEPEYFRNEQWLGMSFDASKVEEPTSKGKLHFVNGDNLVEPQYYLHFTIGKLRNGSYKTLEFDEGKRISEFPEEIELEAGYYVLVTGNRQSDGSVLSSMSYFKVSADSLTNLKVELVRQTDGLKASGKLNPKQLQLQAVGSSNIHTLGELAKDASTVLVIIDPDKEPSKHIMNDLAPYREALTKTGTHFVFVTSEQKAGGLNILKTYDLPDNYVVGIDLKDNILSSVMDEYGIVMKDKLPLVLFLDKEGNVYYFSSGYRIGVGEQLLRTIRQSENELPCNKAKQSCTTP